MSKSSFTFVTLFLLSITSLAHATTLFNHSTTAIEYQIYAPTKDAPCATTVVSTEKGTVDPGKTVRISPAEKSKNTTDASAMCLIVESGKTTLISQFYPDKSCAITYALDTEKIAHLTLTPHCQHNNK